MSEPVSAVAEAAPLRRDTGAGLVGGVISGIGARTGIDTACCGSASSSIAIASGGLALLAYLVAWASIPAEGEGEAPLRRLGLRTGRAAAGGSPRGSAC